MVRKADEPSSWPFKLLLNLVSLDSKGFLTRIQKFEACWNGVLKLSITISGTAKALNPHEQQPIEHIVLSRIHLTIVMTLNDISTTTFGNTILSSCRVCQELPNRWQYLFRRSGLTCPIMITYQLWLSSRVSARPFTRWGCERCGTSKLSHRDRLSAKNGNPKCSSTGCLKCMQSLSQLLLCPIVEHLLVNIFTSKKTS